MRGKPQGLPRGPAAEILRALPLHRSPVPMAARFREPRHGVRNLSSIFVFRSPSWLDQFYRFYRARFVCETRVRAVLSCELALTSEDLCSIDNSEWMRNGDYVPTRMDSQADAVNLICNTKTTNPESAVGVMTMASRRSCSTDSSDHHPPCMNACLRI